MLLENSNQTSPQLHELYCVSAVLGKSGFEFFKFENCKVELPFVCVQRLYETVHSVEFTNISSKLYKANNVETCYYLENFPYSWKDAIEFCKHTHGAKLFNGVKDIDSYSYLKQFIRDQYTKENECDATTWWMDFDDVIEKGMPPHLTYVDWGPSADFNIIEPHGVITLFPDKNIYWSLEQAHKKLGVICKIEQCYDKRPVEPYLIYIEKISLYELNDTEDAVGWLKTFYFRCIPSGWYITDSVSWYKDGILLDVLSNELYLHNVATTESEVLKFQGSYSCSVDTVKKKTLFSSKHVIRAPGFYTFIISMISKASHYLTDCPKYVLSDDLFASTTLYQCFTEHWKDSISFNDFHFHLNHPMCYRHFIQININAYFKNHLPEEEILKMLKKVNYSNFCETCNIVCGSIIVNSTAFCHSEKMRLNNTVLKWPTTEIGKSTFPEKMCLTSDNKFIERKCLGDFISGAFWSKISVTECHEFDSPIADNLRNVLISEEIIDSVPHLPNLTSNPELLQSSDVEVAVEILGSLAKPKISFPCDKLDEVVHTISNLIDVNKEVLSVVANSSNRAMNYLEKITSNIDQETCKKNISTKNIQLSVYPLNLDESEVPNGFFYRSNSPNSLPSSRSNASTDDLLNNMQNFEAGLVIPNSLLRKESNASDHLLYSISKSMYYQENDSAFSVVSVVVGVSLHNLPVINLGKENISLLFKLSLTVKEINLTAIQCVSWNVDLNIWSTEGCSVQNSSHNAVLCTCNHLTSFAVTMINLQSSHHEHALKYITFIGSSLSCIGLGIIILSFLAFREWRKSLKNKCLCNFSISYFLFLVIYMAGIDKTSSRDLCKVTAAFLHYFLLTSFMWMIMLAYTVYLSLVKVFATYIPCFIQKAMAFSWGVPAIIVISILSSKHELYFEEKICWLSKDIFMYGVGIPMILMLVINYLIFGAILYVNTCGAHNITCNQKRRTLYITRAKALFCASILLGLSWIFIFFAIAATGDAQIIFAYLFSLSTALQGFLLAVFFIFLPRKTRQLWLKLFTSPASVFKSHSFTSSSYVT